MKYRVTYTYYLDVFVEANDLEEAYAKADKEGPDPHDDPREFCQQVYLFDEYADEINEEDE